MTTPYIGIVRDSTDVERAMVAFLQRWMPWYVARIEDQTDGMSRGDHPMPKTWDLRADLRTFPEDRLPIVLAMGTGTAAKPERHGRGATNEAFGLGVVVVAQGQNADGAKTNASVYAKAIKAAVTQRQSLETDWITEINYDGARPDRLPPQETRELASVTQAFTVYASATVDPSKGPGVYVPEPPADPTEPDPGRSYVGTHEVDIEVEQQQEVP